MNRRDFTKIDKTYDALADLFLSDKEHQDSTKTPANTTHPNKLTPNPADNTPGNIPVHHSHLNPADPLTLQNQAESAVSATPRCSSDDREKTSPEAGRPASSLHLRRDDLSDGVAADESFDVEVVLPGHLPILSGPWIAQYADRVAEHAGGRTALVQLRNDRTALELFNPPDDQVRLLSPAGAIRERPGSFSQAVAATAPYVSRWLIRWEGNDYANLVTRKGITSISLLGGTDEAAIVAAYRTIKNIVLASRETETTVPMISYATVGADAASARRAVARLAQSARRFLGTEVREGIVIPRMRPLFAEQVGRWPGRTNLSQVLQQIIHQHEKYSAPPVESAPAINPQKAEAETEQVPAAENDELIMPPEPASAEKDRSVIQRAVAASHVVADLHPYAPTSDLFTGSDTAGKEAKSSSDVNNLTGEQAETFNDRLVNHIVGLIPLSATCPFAQDVELAVDKTGTLHLLTVFEGDDDRTAQLLAAESWLKQHGELIKLAHPHLNIDTGRQSVMHMFTTAARRARPLLDSSVRLHLLVNAIPRPGFAQICADLN